MYRVNYNIIEKENIYIGYEYDLLCIFKDILDLLPDESPYISNLLSLVHDLRNNYDEELLEVKFDYDYNYTITKFIKEEK